MADSTLTAVRNKVRRLTRSPSEDLLPTVTLDDYVNTFVLYDFPEHLRLFALRSTFTFYTAPYIDTYGNNTFDPLDPFYNFKNKYITTHEPAYCSGYQLTFSQSREQFFGMYPFVNSIVQLPTSGDGVTVQYRGYINAQNALVPANLQQQQNVLLQDNVTFSGQTEYIPVGAPAGVSAVAPLAMHDIPLSYNIGNTPFTTLGNLYAVGNEPAAPPTVLDPNNYINYVTGQYVVTFPSAPLAGSPIFTESVPLVAAQPLGLLYYDYIFTIRPVPDKVYPINLEVYLRPTELLAGQSPYLEQWWQYIAYGAAKKVFEDRMDMDSVQMIMPEFKKQEALVNRTTIVQQTKERTASIYTEQTAGGSGSGWGWGAGGLM